MDELENVNMSIRCGRCNGEIDMTACSCNYLLTTKCKDCGMEANTKHNVITHE